MKNKVYEFLTKQGYDVDKNVPYAFENSEMVALIMKARFFEVKTVITITFNDGVFELTCGGGAVYENELIFPFQGIRVSGSALDDELLTVLLEKMKAGIKREELKILEGEQHG